MQARSTSSAYGRYAEVPALLYEIDNEWEYAVPIRSENRLRCKRAFNAFLKERYGTEEELRRAWRDPPLKFGSVELPRKSNDWTSVPTADLVSFWADATRKGVNSFVGPVKAAEPRHFTSASAGKTIGRLNFPIVATYDCDFSEIHYYGSSSGFCACLKATDMRALGKSFSIGQFGAKVHPAWGEASKPGYQGINMKGATDWFLQVGHCALGMGASFVANWGWKDTMTRIFPWGLNHPGDEVPKDVLLAYRNMSLFFRCFRPKYEKPQVCFVLPDNHRFGARRGAVNSGIFNGIKFLLATHTDFAVINEDKLSKLPSSVKVLVYPIPFCPSDATFDIIKDFVRAGGSLYVSGDLSYDPERRRTRTERLRDLCGVEFVAQNYPNIQHAGVAAEQIVPKAPGLPGYDGRPCVRVRLRLAGARVLAETKQGSPVIVRNTLGAGTVFFCADPIELTDSPTGTDIYKAFLRSAGAPRNALVPDNPNVYLFRLPTTKNEDLYVLFNADPASERKEVTIRAAVPGTLTINRWKPGLVLLGPKGEVRAVEASGDVKVNGRLLVRSNAHAMIVALDDKGLTESEALLVFPLNEGSLRIASKSAWNDFSGELGELRQGKWTVLETLPAQRTLQIDQDRKMGIIFAVRKRDRAKYVRKVELLVNHPEEL